MRKTTSPLPPSTPEAKRVAFFPFQPDIIRLQKFAAIYAEAKGLDKLGVHPALREVFNSVLDYAEIGYRSVNGNGHAPEAAEPDPPPKRGKK